jgi:hypothetical protein
MSERKVVEERDVYIKLPKEKVYLINHFTTKDVQMTNKIQDLVGIRRKPMQEKIEMEYEGTLV